MDEKQLIGLDRGFTAVVDDQADTFELRDGPLRELAR